MKKNFIFSLVLLSSCSLAALAQPQKDATTFTIEVSNHWNRAKTDEPIVIDLHQLNLGFQVKSAMVMDGSTEIPSQVDDLNGDRRADELAFVIDLPAGSKKRLKINLSAQKSNQTYPSRVFAEMLVSDKRGKHVPVHAVTIPGTSNIYSQMHHHGPALESELVAYRLYFDQKQTIDIYGKFNKGFEIKESQFYPTDEQLARGFGDDVLLVGGSCGVGALKGWDGKKATHIEPISTLTERIIAYGPVRTIAEIEVTDWQYQGKELQLTNRYTLYAGHRDLKIESRFAAPLTEEVFCTGVLDIPGSVSFSDHKGLIGCWGTNWPVNDTIKYAKETVGLATCIPQKYVKAEVKDKPNYLYTIGAKGAHSFSYHTTFTSMKETFGYKTPEAWFAYIRQWKEELEHPAEVVLNDSLTQ